MRLSASNTQLDVSQLQGAAPRRDAGCGPVPRARQHCHLAVARSLRKEERHKGKTDPLYIPTPTTHPIIVAPKNLKIKIVPKQLESAVLQNTCMAPFP